MIIVKLMGGLGNQMFQYAIGRNLSALHKTDLKLDLSFLKIDPKGTYTKRNFELEIFNIKAGIASEKDCAPFLRRAGNKYIRTIQRKLPVIFNKTYIAESGHFYHKEFMSYPREAYLDGFWQSEKYFKASEKLIREDFTFKKELGGLNRELAEKIAGVNSISMHVRRGDYVMNEQVLAYHGVCGVEYYRNALEAINEKNTKPELFIFSDDSEWCRQNLKFDANCVYVDHNKGDQSYIDMQLMSLCKHNIIANSSFSWWGAWLNANPDKKVVAPAKWFNDPNAQTPDIYPESWIII
jgi:hypothetical protein